MVPWLHVHLEADAEVGLLIHVHAPAPESDDALPQHLGRNSEDDATGIRENVLPLGGRRESIRVVDCGRIASLRLDQADEPLERGSRGERRSGALEGTCFAEARLGKPQHFRRLHSHDRPQVSRPLSTEASNRLGGLECVPDRVPERPVHRGE